VIGLHRFKLQRHIVDGTVMSVCFKQVFHLNEVRLREVSMYYTILRKMGGILRSENHFVWKKQNKKKQIKKSYLFISTPLLKNAGSSAVEGMYAYTEITNYK